MKVIITKNFGKKYLNDLLKYFTEDDFIKFLKTKNHTFIGLHDPYFKVKGYVNTISIRGMLFLIENDSIVPLMIFLKKDKKYGENINWALHEEKILIEHKKALLDIKNKDYKEF